MKFKKKKIDKQEFEAVAYNFIRQLSAESDYGLVMQVIENLKQELFQEKK